MDRKKTGQGDSPANEAARPAADEALKSKKDKKQKAVPEEKPELQQEKDESNLVNFKKVVRGFNPSEVYDYIAFQNANLKNARKVFDTQIEELKGDLAFVSRERDKFKEEQKEMAERVEAYEQRFAEYKTAADELDSLKSQNTQLQEQVKSLFSKLASCKNLLAENQQFKRRIAEIDKERGLFENEKAKLNTEIGELRETNTKQAYAYAEQKKDIEQRFYNEQLRVSELLQVHTYHIQKSEELLNEMYKQFSLAKKSLDEINTKK